MEIENRLVITATNRLAAKTTEAHNLAMASRGLACWPSPRIMALSAWLVKTWEELWQESVLPGKELEEALFEEIIREDAQKHGLELLDFASTAALALQARTLAKLYCANGWYGVTPEEKSFLRWNQAFERELAKRGWVDAASLPEKLLPLLGGMEAPVLAGFDDVLPAHAKLWAALERNGAKVEKLPMPDLAGEARLYAEATTIEDEITACADWAIEEVKAGRSVGIIPVDISTYSIKIQQIFKEKLSPSAVFVGKEEKPLYDISLSGALSAEPVVAGAMNLLTSIGDKEADFWREFLLNPYVFEGGVGLYSFLQKQGIMRLSLGGLIDEGYRAKAKNQDVDGLLEKLKNLQKFRDEGKRLAPPSVWAQTLVEELKLVGFRFESSREFQAYQSFLEALHSLSGLDQISGNVARSWVLAKLGRKLQNPFRIKVQKTSIAIMGLLEASGLSFDSLWILGLDASYPPPAVQNPFIPYEVQRKAGMRDAIPELGLEHSAKILERAIKSAKKVVISYNACEDASLSPLAPADLPQAVVTGHPGCFEQIQTPVELEVLADAPVPTGEVEEPKGGVQLIADQARCPFKAFVRHRLGARLPDEPEDGITRFEQGNAIHKVLHDFYQMFPKRIELSNTEEGEIDRAIADCVEAGIKTLNKDKKLGPKIIEIERKRLTQTAKLWVNMDLEAGREFEVLERETARTLLLNKLKISLKVDRIDEIEGGHAFIIDYKNKPKEADISKLLSEERLTSPQLPIYALACEGVKGFGYGLLDRGGCELKDYASDEIGGKCADWENQKTAWLQKLQNLADEFCQGDVFLILDPQDCPKCEFLGVCRYMEAANEIA